MKKSLMVIVVGLTVAGCLLGCEEKEPEPATQGRFLVELIRRNEEKRGKGGDRWVDPATCDGSSVFIARAAKKAGIVATELPPWVADWEILARPPAGETVPLMYKRIGPRPQPGPDVRRIAVYRRNGRTDTVEPETFREELLRLFGTTDGITVGGHGFTIR